MEPRIDNVTIGVTGLRLTLDFYEYGFRFPIEKRGRDSARLRLGASAALELCKWETLARHAGLSPTSSGFRGVTLSYVVADSTDVDAMLARLVAAGGTVVKEPRFAFWGYSGHVTDPSGHLWKIASPRRKRLLGRARAGSGARTKPVPAKELAVTIGVGDMNRAKRFYKDGLDNPTKKEHSQFVMFEGGNGTPDLGLYKWDALADDANVPPDGNGFRGLTMSHVVDSVDALDRLLEKAARAGGQILSRTSDGPRDSAHFADVDGHLWRIAARA